MGSGPPDLVFVPGWVWSIESLLGHPGVRDLVGGLASLGRLLVFDKRGTGLSDRVRALPDVEQRADDLRAVLDAVGSERAVVVGVSEGGPLALTFAARFPERVAGVVVYASHARMTPGPGYPWGHAPAELTRVARYVESRWGEGRSASSAAAPPRGRRGTCYA
jgi:pimeloyl-ACP methyl ester carboxylesterase